MFYQVSTFVHFTQENECSSRNTTKDLQLHWLYIPSVLSFFCRTPVIFHTKKSRYGLNMGTVHLGPVMGHLVQNHYGLDMGTLQQSRIDMNWAWELHLGPVMGQIVWNLYELGMGTPSGS